MNQRLYETPRSGPADMQWTIKCGPHRAKVINITILLLFILNDSFRVYFLRLAIGKVELLCFLLFHQ
jgi:hypothetical protein